MLALAPHNALLSVIFERRRSMHVALRSHKLLRVAPTGSPDNYIMAYHKPPFRPSFPMLLASGLLLAQPMTSLAVGQVECRASEAGAGWSCSSLEAPAALPPRPERPAPAAAQAEQANQQAGASSRPSRDATAISASEFSGLDWVPRDQLNAAQRAAIAPYCGGTYVEPPRTGRDDDTPFEELPIYAEADSSRFEQGNQTGTLEGDVLLRQGRLQARADAASYDRNNDIIQLQDQVRLRDQGVLVLGDNASMRVDTGETRIEGARYVMHQAHARGAAETIKRRDDGVIVMTNGTYTTCEPGENTWTLHAKDVELDREKGWGEAKHVRLHVKDVPVLYTPYLYFPLDERRQTGLLTPSYGSSTDSGAYVTVPYYFNLAPNYDATLYPTFMTKRGALLDGEVRHMSAVSYSQLNAAYLNDKEFGEDRWMYRARHEQRLSQRWYADIDTGSLSDPYYFQDLDTALDARPDIYMDQRGALNYFGDNYTFRALVHGYELATVTAVTPYERMPQLQLDGGNPLGAGVRFDYSLQYTHFDRDLSDGLIYTESGGQYDDLGVLIRKPDESLVGLQRATGHRASAIPKLSLPLRNTWGFLTPAVSVYSVAYDLQFDERADGFDYQQADRTPSNTVPVASLDSGLYFDRRTSWLGRSLRQTLEPRAFYLYAPYRDQSDQPLFDTYETTFSYASLYREDRFSGRDRTGDANQLTLGTTSRLLDDAGRERARASLGQIFYFRDRDVRLLDMEGLEDPRDEKSSSAYAAELVYQMHDDWRLSSNLLWDPDDSDSNAGDIRVNYQPEPRKIINVGYRYRNELNTFDSLTGTYFRDPNRRIDQSDVSFIWPINPQWSVIGRWQHDLADNRTLEALGGIEYDSCCWKFRFINRYWVDYNEYESIATDEPNRGIFFQIVLKGLGNVTGNRVESLLDEGIPGYRERENNAF